MHNKDNEKRKKRYEKPRVIRFPLRPEEAVLGFCKSPSVTATPGTGCASGFGPCKFSGS
jgi:hypothetical protein